MFRWNRYHDCDHALNPWVGGGCDNSQSWVTEAAQRPGRGLSMPLAPTACPPAGGAWPRPLSLQHGAKWAPRETLSKAFLSQNASVPRKGMLCVACMDGLSTHPSPNLIFSLGERKVAGEEAKRPGRCQHSNGKGLPLE